ncbi:MAG: caspase family protein [Prevotella sp.]|nr:caspase family protein [Prevotella sp.]MBR1556807.1 caspase family protein [Prevotella sp.]
MIVFSAAQGDETAHQMEEKHHGLFTYYLLKELQATGGEVDMGTLTEYVTKQVKRQSVVINNKKQTPTVVPSKTLAEHWQGIKLR